MHKQLIRTDTTSKFNSEGKIDRVIFNVFKVWMKKPIEIW